MKVENTQSHFARLVDEVAKWNGMYTSYNDLNICNTFPSNLGLLWTKEHVIITCISEYLQLTMFVYFLTRFWSKNVILLHFLNFEYRNLSTEFSYYN